MYLDHFGLREAPFRITPHTEFFFAGANRGATLEALIYAITHDDGIVKVSGEVGSGKTMLCRMLLEKLPEKVETVYLGNPLLSRNEILHVIADELDSPPAKGRANLILRSLQKKLLDIHVAGRQVVIMIDEAHAMPPETLEEIRLLSNLETNQHKLLHIVLFGQPELDDRLNRSNMRQLKERITHNFALEPLRCGDIGTYLMFRIRAAGYRGPDLFTPGAIQLICKASHGLTRRINILADKALLSAFSENKHQIESRQIKAAIRDAQFNPMFDANAKPKTWLSAAAIATVVACLAYLAGSYKPVIVPAQAPLPVPVPALTKEVLPNVVTASKPVKLEPVPQAMAPTTPPVSPSASNLDQQPTIEERITVTQEWLKNTSNSHFFIQLLSTDGNSTTVVEEFLRKDAKGLDPQQLRVYRSKLSGRERLGVIYGDYPSLEAASADLARVARASPSSKPYIRGVGKLR